MRLDRKIWLRNAVELIAGAIAIAAFTWYFLASDSSWHKFGSVLILLGVVFALVNLRFRAGAGRQIRPKIAAVTMSLNSCGSAMRCALWRCGICSRLSRGCSFLKWHMALNRGLSALPANWLLGSAASAFLRSQPGPAKDRPPGSSSRSMKPGLCRPGASDHRPSAGSGPMPLDFQSPDDYFLPARTGHGQEYINHD